MSGLTQVALRNLLAHKGRLLMTVVSVVLGTSFIAGSLVFTGTLSRAFDGLSANTAKGVDVRVSPEGIDTAAPTESSPGVPLGLAGTLAARGDVRAVQPAVTGTVALRDGRGKVVQQVTSPVTGGEYLAAGHSLDPAGTPIVTGHAPQGPGEMVINSGAAARLDLPTGATTQVVTGRSAGVTTMKVVGTYSTAADTGAYVNVLFAHDTAVRLLSNGTTVPYIDLAAKGVSAQQLSDALAKQYPQYQVQTGDQVRAAYKDQVDKGLTFINYFLIMFGVIGLLVGVCIIYNTFSMIVAQRLKELALLRAIGASRGQVRNSVVLEAVVVGLLGGVIGLGVGIGLAYLLRWGVNKWGSGFPDAGLTVSWWVVVTVIVVGAVVTVASALIPAIRAARTPPVAAMREQDGARSTDLTARGAVGFGLTVNAVALLFVASTTIGTGSAICVGVSGFALVLAVIVGGPAMVEPVLGRIGRWLTATYGAAGKLGATNVARNPQRTTATAFALVIGVGMVGIIGTLGSSMHKTVDQRVDTGMRSTFVLQSPVGVMPADTVSTIKNVQGVSGETVQYVLPAKVGDDRMTGIGVDGTLSDSFHLDRVAGDVDPGPGGMLVDQDTAAKHGWQIGSKVTLVSLLDGSPVTVDVTGTYVPQPNLITGWIVDSSVMNRLYPSGKGATAGLIAPLNIWVNTTPGADQASVKAALQKALDPLMTVQVFDQQGVKDQAATMITSLLGVLYALLALAIVIAVLGIVNTLALSVVERRREIGMLRATGMLRAQVRRSIYLESALISVFGAALGLVIGVAIGAAMVHALRNQGLSAIEVPWTTVLYMLAGSAVVGVIAAVLPAIRAAHTPPLAAIAEG
ncbi:ABC transporter permease [Tsukamurella soli]|uniref:FtsX-like permease family protein n=1 Tax=Tsukamurella soli TaxID=644556 RepID=A0ABP8KK79_9ACTN